MVQISVDEAKTHLSRLLLRVEGGEEIVINRSGVPVAKLVPIAPNPAQNKSLIEEHVAESREQIKNGQFFGPFSTAEEAIESLHNRDQQERLSAKR